MRPQHAISAGEFFGCAFDRQRGERVNLGIHRLNRAFPRLMLGFRASVLSSLRRFAAAQASVVGARLRARSSQHDAEFFLDVARPQRKRSGRIALVQLTAKRLASSGGFRCEFTTADGTKNPRLAPNERAAGQNTQSTLAARVHGFYLTVKQNVCLVSDR